MLPSPPPWQANPPLSRKQGQGGERASQFLYRSPWTDYIRCNQTIMVFGRYIGKKNARKSGLKHWYLCRMIVQIFFPPFRFPFPFSPLLPCLIFSPKYYIGMVFRKFLAKGNLRGRVSFYIGHSCRSVGRGGRVKGVLPPRLFGKGGNTPPPSPQTHFYS